MAFVENLHEEIEYMAQIRLSKLIKQFRVGLAQLVVVLNDAGCPVEPNPNAKISDEWLPMLRAWAAENGHEEMMPESNLKGIPSSQSEAQELVLTSEPVIKKSETKKVSEEALKSDSILKEQGTTEWELIVKHAIKAIPSPRTKEANQFILDKIATWLREGEVEINGVQTENQPAFSDETSAEEVLGRLVNGEPGFVEACFSIDDPSKIKAKRNLALQVLQQEALSPDYFWSFINTLLAVNTDVYRSAIGEAVSAYKYGKDYLPDAQSIKEFCAATELLLKNHDKCHQALPFFVAFSDCLPEIVRQDIQNATKYLKSIDDLLLAFRIMKSSLHEKLYLLSVNETTASQYLGFSLLKEEKDKNGIESVRKEKYLPTYMNCIYETLAWSLINKLVLGEYDEMSDETAATIVSEGYDSYVKYLDNIKGRQLKREHAHAIQDYLGRKVYFKYEGDNQWNVFGSTRDGYGFILPKSWVSEEIQKDGWYYATVVKFTKKPNLLVLSQVPVSKASVIGASTVHENDIVEARFSLYEKSISTKILGCGPTSAQLVSIPRNFDYKIKHKVRVLRVYDVNKCDVQVVK